LTETDLMGYITKERIPSNLLGLISKGARYLGRD